MGRDKLRIAKFVRSWQKKLPFERQKRLPGLLELRAGHENPKGIIRFMSILTSYSASVFRVLNVFCFAVVNEEPQYLITHDLNSRVRS